MLIPLSMFDRWVSCSRTNAMAVTWFCRTALVCPANRSMLSWLAVAYAPLSVVGSPSSSNCSNRSLYTFIAASKFRPAACTAALKRFCSASVKPSNVPLPSSSNPCLLKLLYCILQRFFQKLQSQCVFDSVFKHVVSHFSERFSRTFPVLERFYKRVR